MAGGAAVSRWGRLILLMCTLFGLAAMHTLGHAHHGRHGGHAEAGHQASALADEAGMEVSGPVMPCSGDGCRLLSPGSGSQPGGVSGWSVCLAVLSAFAFAVLLAMVLRQAVGGGLPVWWRAPPGPTSGRSPPASRVGLRLATVSVMRT